MSRYKQEKSDAIVSTRCKSTTLATIVRYFREQGVFVANRSNLIRLSIEAFEQYLVEEKDVIRCTSIAEARNLLSSGGIGNLNPGGRSGKAFLEEGEREASVLDSPQEAEAQRQQPEFEDMEPWQQEAVERLNREREESAQAPTEKEEDKK